jgi:hypothetical protein
MSTKQFMVIAFALIGILLAMLFIETHRRCTERGYKDCPRIGAHIWPDYKRQRE